MEDSLLSQRPEDPKLKAALIKAHLSLGRGGNRKIEYGKILKLDPGHSEARYFMALDEGRRLYNKGSENELWDALLIFGRAAAIIDTMGEPYYWMAKCYVKKDEMDFELILEAFDNALNLFVSDSLLIPLKKDRTGLIKRKAVFEDFWK